MTLGCSTSRFKRLVAVFPLVAFVPLCFQRPLSSWTANTYPFSPQNLLEVQKGSDIWGSHDWFIAYITVWFWTLERRLWLCVDRHIWAWCLPRVRDDYERLLWYWIKQNATNHEILSHGPMYKGFKMLFCHLSSENARKKSNEYSVFNTDMY